MTSRPKDPSPNPSGGSGVQIGPVRRVYLLGGGELLLRTAEWLRAQKAEAVVVTSPRHARDAAGPKGRTFAAAVAALRLPCRVVKDINDAKEWKKLPAFGADSLALCFGAAWIFKTETIRGLFQDKLFNVHSSRLPQDRGGGGYSWYVLMNNRFGFCTLNRIDGGIDTGDILAFEEFLFPAACRTPQDYADVHVGKKFVFIRDFLKGVLKKRRTFKPLAQPEYLSSYWPRLNTDLQGWIDWGWPVDRLDRFVCAFDDPYAGAQTLWNGVEVRLKRSMPAFADGVFHPYQRGLVYRNNGRWLCVAAEGGSLIVQRVLDADGNDILGKVRVGDRFHTPAERLEQAAKRVVYTAEGMKVI